jgi:hypothetical protein
MYSFKFVILLLLTFSFVFAVGEKTNTAPRKSMQLGGFNLAKSASTLVDAPDVPYISWIGVGKLSQITISNMGINGEFTQPGGWPGFDGTQITDLPTTVNTGEFPRGTQQFYIFTAGLWVGAEVVTERDEQTGEIITVSQRVACSSYDQFADFAPLSPLFQSDQIYPPGHEHEGKKVYKQFGLPQEDYQILWPFADTTVNLRREPFILNENQLADPDRGDLISDQDTYAVFGDYFPEDEVVFLSRDSYDTQPVGIRVEARTYSFQADSYVFFNYYITNMNTDTLYNLYFGYFMDNDIGDEYLDDLIGYDESLDMGYSFDSDLAEAGWQTSAGYIGSAFLRTPLGPDGEELGITGFQTWENGSDEGPDLEGQDLLRYDQLSRTGFETFDNPQDVRQLMNSGPIEKLAPGEEFEVTVAVVAGASLAELRRNVESAYERYEIGFIAPAPPLPPNVVYTPADERIIMGWSDDPSETTVDPQTGLLDFEGYRVYISDDGGQTWGETADDLDRYPSGYVPLAEFDITGNSYPRYTSAVYAIGSSNAQINNPGLAEELADFDDTDPFIANRYAIEFLTDTTLFVYNISKNQSMSYNAGYFSNLNNLNGWVMTDSIPSGTTLPADIGDLDIWPDAQYRSGSYIWLDGGVVQIINDSTEFAEFPESVKPSQGDVFIVENFESAAIGPQAGLDYVYQITSYGFPSEDLRNGIPYQVAVTAFDQGDPTIGLPSLESAIQATATTLYPRALPTGFVEESISEVTQTFGTDNGVTLTSNGSVSVTSYNPRAFIDGNYTVRFFGDDDEYHIAEYAEISLNGTPIVTDEQDLDSVVVSSGGFSLRGANGIDGFNLVASGPRIVTADVERSGWNRFLSFDFVISSGNAAEPYDYRLTFPEAIPGDVNDYQGDTLVFPPGSTFRAPFLAENTTLGTKPDIMAFPLSSSDGWSYSIDGVRNGVTFIILDKTGGFGNQALLLTLDVGDSILAPEAGDYFDVYTSKPFRNGETYEFSTQSFGKFIKSEYDLSDVKVVPNPYIIRADWDPNKFNRRVKFTHLPEKCTLRIFTISGLLVKTIDHDGTTEVGGTSGAGFHSWNLRDENDLDVPSGVYLFQVKDDDTGDKYVGKFAVIM